ncbi:MAG: molybdate ABC transporter substrate-binding protein [Deltaproteobacteria bacterium]|nr:molybdate ABC transporter substrate-binding protein [Deltaproteobacteria bacterium]MDQ3296758.1 molybdate ABC transporter substrate-binding protein [Myxococcota bacterium]
MQFVVAVVLATVLCGGCSKTSGERVVRIGAASDLAKAFTELGKEFETRTGIRPEFTFGSSGLLSKQIAQGAPYFLFAAANKAFVDKVIEAGVCDGKTARTYGRGRVVVWTAGGTPAPKQLSELTEPRFKRIALANPDHAPYGVAGKQALEKSGLWAQLESRIVLAENVQATMLYARDGNADAAIVALSLAVVSDGGAYLPIDQFLHDPLDQQLVVCGKGAEADAARKFAELVASAEGRELMTRYGFVVPP